VQDDIAQDCDVLFAVRGDTISLARAPPAYGLDPIAAFRGAQRVFGELVQFHAMAQQFVQLFVHIEGAPAQSLDRGIRAEYLEIKPVAVEGDDVREGFKLRYEVLCVRLKPAPEIILLVPGYGDGDAESGDVRPAPLDFVRQAQRFNVQVDFAIKQSGRMTLLG